MDLEQKMVNAILREFPNMSEKMAKEMVDKVLSIKISDFAKILSINESTDTKSTPVLTESSGQRMSSILSATPAPMNISAAHSDIKPVKSAAPRLAGLM